MKKTAIVICGIIFSLVVLEISLRVVAFVSITLKESRNIIGLSRKDTYRVMCLGESTTACSNYPEMLENYLNDKPAGIKFTVFNKGVTAVNSSYILEQLELNLEECKPNMVIVMMGINDSQIKYYEDIPDSDSFLFKEIRVYRLLRIMMSYLSNELHEKKSSCSNKMIDNPIDDTKKLELGNYYFGLGNYRKAEEYFKERIKENPNDGVAYRQLGTCYNEQGGRCEEGAALLRKAIALNPKDYIAYIKLGFSLISLQKYDEAIKVFNLAIKLNPIDQEAYLNLAKVYNLKRDFIKAERILLDIVNNHDDEQIYYELGWSYINQNKFENIDSLFKKAIKSHSSNPRIYGIFSVLYWKMGRYVDSEACHNKANEERISQFNPVTIINYQNLKKALDKRKIRLVCMQYPMYDLSTLKNIFLKQKDVLFVDNEKVFKNAIIRESYKEYFSDTFGGNFGHCTNKGDMLIAENVANVILKEILGNH